MQQVSFARFLLKYFCMNHSMDIYVVDFEQRNGVIFIKSLKFENENFWNTSKNEQSPGGVTGGL